VTAVVLPRTATVTVTDQETTMTGGPVAAGNVTGIETATVTGNVIGIASEEIETGIETVIEIGTGTGTVIERIVPGAGDPTVTILVIAIVIGTGIETAIETGMMDTVRGDPDEMIIHHQGGEDHQEEATVTKLNPGCGP
jgi:hypothetical protein